jgi:uncharacterized protein (DUF1330 family)
VKEDHACRGLDLAAFLIVKIKSMRDESTYARNSEQVSATPLTPAGEYLVRGSPEGLEENWEPGRVGFVRFDLCKLPRTNGIVQIMLN